MGKLIQLVTSLHQKTKRDYLERMLDEKSKCMAVAKRYDKDYWDGLRRFGYGGYKYIPGRWRQVAQDLIDRYALTNKSKVLDVGCGKGYLLSELKMLLPELHIVGTDLSPYAIQCANPEIRKHILLSKAQDKLVFEDQYFDLVISLGVLHNLQIFELEMALNEIQRVGKNGYVMVESYRNEVELFNLQCWALTAVSFFNSNEWEWVYKKFGYHGDYEFIYFE